VADLTAEAFRCRECGLCCHDLLDDRGGTKRGLTLTTKEASLFNPNLIVPLAAFGYEKPETIFLYQLETNDCPFVDQKNKCLIYEKRPLVCRAFPLSQGSFSTKCALFRFLKDFPENMVKVYMDWGKTQLDAERALDEYIVASFRENFSEGIATWSFDLASERWVMKKRYACIDEVIEF
jgi:Fe-S-cluster containining protein